MTARSPHRWLSILLAILVATAACAAPNTTPSAEPAASASVTPTGQATPSGAGPSTPVSPAPTTPRASSPDASPPSSAPPTSTPGPSPSAAPSDPVGGTFPSTIDADLDRLLRTELGRLREAMVVPGISVAVRLPSGETWAAAEGLASLDPAEPVDEETVFAIASITKTFIAALTLQLAEEGALSLDDQLSTYLPTFPGAAGITLRQLLSHTSGLWDFFSTEQYRPELFSDYSRDWTFDQIIDLVRRPYCDPGTCYRYSNTNYVLLGRVAEIATGRPLATLLHRRLLDPLGLEHTFFQPEDPTPDNAAHGHVFADDTRTSMIDVTGDFDAIPHPSAASVAWAAGAMASTPTDLVEWAAALYGGRVLEPDSLAQMVDFSGIYGGYGLGTYSFLAHGRPAVGHTGGIQGFVSVVAYFPADGVAIAATLDRGRSSPQRVLRHLMAVLLGRDVPPA